MAHYLNIENRLVETALSQLTRDPIVAEYNRRPADEQPEFMMAFACYVMWLIMVGASRTYEPTQVERIIVAIHSAFAKRDWYRSGLFEQIWNSIQDSLPRMKPGRHTGILVPLVHVIEAANHAGCHLQHTNDMEVIIDSSIIVNQLIEAAASPEQNLVAERRIVACESCGADFRVPSVAQTLRVACPHCQHKLLIPPESDHVA